MRKFIIVFMLGMIIVSCSNTTIKHIDVEKISWGKLKIHDNGTLIRDISLTENPDLLKEIVELYNTATFLSVDKENRDFIFTNGPLEEKISGTYIDIKESENNYYIGYKGDNTFKVITSGDDFSFYIKSEELKEIIIENTK